MASRTSPQRPAPRSALGRLTARHPVVAFLVMVFAVNTAVELVPALTRRDILPFDLALYESLGPVFGVALPAFVVVGVCGGRDGVRDLRRRSLRWRVALRWYLFAFLSVPIAVLACASAVFGSSMLDVLAMKWTLLFTAVLPRLLFLIVFFIVAEEIGFTGFLQARLQDEYGPLKASVLATLPFALYHLPGLMVEMGLGLTRIHVALGYLGILAVLQMFGRVVIMWLYNATGNSVLLVGLWHSSFDATTQRFLSSQCYSTVPEMRRQILSQETPGA